MKLLKVFNKHFISVLQILHESFNDDVHLTNELESNRKKVEKNESTEEIHNEFLKNTDQDTIDRIFKCDVSVIMENKINFLQRANLSAIYKDRMYKEEHTVFWENLKALCRYSSMLRACGTQLTDMEDMALSFMDNNKDCAPEDYHMKLFQEMLSGGDMSKKLMKTFQDPSCIKNILSNVGNIMKTGDGEDGKSVIPDFGKMLNLEDGDLEELTKGVRETLQEKITTKEDGEKTGSG